MDKQQQKFSAKKRLKSFGYAFNGLKILIQEEHNSRIHLVAAIIIVVLGFFFHINVFEWIALIISIAFVIVCEIFNSAIENIADFISPKRHIMIKKIKDLAAAGVLLSAFSALIVGGIIFLPKIFEWL